MVEKNKVKNSENALKYYNKNKGNEEYMAKRRESMKRSYYKRIGKLDEYLNKQDLQGKLNEALAKITELETKIE